MSLLFTMKTFNSKIMFNYSKLLIPKSFSSSTVYPLSPSSLLSFTTTKPSLCLFASPSHNLKSFSSYSSSSSSSSMTSGVGSSRGSSLTSSMSSSNLTNVSRLVALNLPPETIGDKMYRWIDITGFLTRWNSRKAWIMYLDPYTRICSIMMTEYERKLRMFLNINELMMFSLSVWIWWYFMNHLNSHPPPPKLTPDGINAEHLGAHWNPFSRLPFIQPRNRCYECRWLDLECKRRCFDKLRAEGHKFVVRQYPLTEPRYKLEPPHHLHHGGGGGGGGQH
eukprot:GHVS01032104.1.p1 GENE.GHVS01032104.1~~GHVS01032104.1.p1  ORF type:complete len:279 (+),score=26.43 GHVS01032104.1:88-924(+)